MWVPKTNHTAAAAAVLDVFSTSMFIPGGYFYHGTDDYLDTL